MTCTDLTFQETLNAVRGARKIANPNFGFQRQLQNYENSGVKIVNNNLAIYSNTHCFYYDCY
jgi:hypothetical protein